MSRRIIIIGGPRAGKSTLSEKLRDELGIKTLRCSHDVEHLGWSESSDFASKWFDDQGDWIIEGVQMARALRKWLRANPDKPLDADILTLHHPFEMRLPGQESMTKGMFTVFREIQGELAKRGARVHKLKDPKDAIDIFRSRDLGEAESQQQRKPMLIEYTKEQFDALPVAQQKLCAEKDGKYTFEFETPSEVAGLKQNRDKVLADLKKAKDDLAGYSGIDPAKYAELMEAHEAAERAALEGKGQWQVLEQQLKDQAAQREKQLLEKHQKEIEERETSIKSLSSALEAKLVDAEVVSALSKHTKAVKLLEPHVKARVKVFNEDGKFTAKVIDEKGNPRIGDAQGTPMTIEQLVEEMKVSEDYLRAFDANTVGGGGATHDGRSVQGADLSKLSPVERLKAANKQSAAA
jgi:hypothetical protein